MKNSNMWWRWGILVALCTWSVWLATPLNEKMTLGIDLSGGYRFVLGVDYDSIETESGDAPTEAEKRQAQEQALEVLRNRIDSAGTREAVVYKEQGTGRIVFEIPGVGDEERQKLEDLIKRPAVLRFRMVHPDNFQLVSELFANETELPGYRLVSLEGESYYQLDPDSEEDLSSPEYFESFDQAVNSVSPAHMRAYNIADVLMQKELVGTNEVFVPYYVERESVMAGKDIRRSRPDYDEYGQVQVALTLTSEGSRTFFDVTNNYQPGGSENPGENAPPRLMGIVMDDTLYSAPRINEAIAGGSAVITGQFTFEEASSLSAALNSGSLPAKIEILMQQSVDPTLGEESIDAGIRAALIGLGAVVIFMLCYYLLAGVVVNVALILDALLLPLGMFVAAGFLGIFGSGGAQAGLGGVNALPTLTLPGIAGLVLTIGMAVDANVLIFERIREEQKAGKRLTSAISSGFEKAFSTIFDANITTLLVAVILFTQGSGPIRGFAVMLTAGILVSMYTALVFTRMGFDLIAKTSLEQVKMLSILPDNLNIPFLSWKKFAFGLSAALLLAGGVSIAQRGSDVLGIDFTGGASMLFQVPSEDLAPGQEELDSLLAGLGISESVIQYQESIEGEGPAGQTLQVRVDSEFTDLAKDSILETYGESAGLELLQLEQIGPQVGEELRSRGIRAIVFALIGIVIYITIRFEFAFAVGTIAALAHDVLITVGIYCLLGRQLSLPIVAALLTIVGYSANDTIVVFDRIREDLKLLKGKPYKEIANLSINQTFSRTLLTSLTTFITTLILFLFGGGAIQDFALALCIGVVVGTYSSTFVATPVMLLWHKEENAA
jgi:SecD/SecF fusion protein